MDRVSRLCEPVTWGGRLASSISILFDPNGDSAVAGVFGRGYQRCRFIAWRQFYAEEYRLAMEQLQQEREAAAKQASDQKNQDATDSSKQEGR